MERREPNTKARGRVVAVALAASLVPVMGGGADGLWTMLGNLMVAAASADVAAFGWTFVAYMPG